MTEYGVVLFFTNSSVMQAEKVLKKDGLNLKLIPTPRQFSNDCGISLRFNWCDCNRVATLLRATGVEIESIERI